MAIDMKENSKKANPMVKVQRGIIRFSFCVMNL